MNYSERVRIKLYYKFWNLFIKKNRVKIPEHFNSKKNLFIYFDYEREFGGHITQIKDENIFHLLKFLRQYNIKTTWFTVGKIFEKYPDTIDHIIQDNHEIGSHTYSHIPPLLSTRSALRQDFVTFSKKSPKNIVITGFHSPNGLWAIKGLKLMVKNGFSYDVIKGTCVLSLPKKIKLSGNKKILRLYTVGDDWPLFKSNPTREDVLRYLEKMVETVQKGEIVGIGFHPWVLFSNFNVLKGFEDFVDYLCQQTDINIQPAGLFVKEIENYNRDL